MKKKRDKIIIEFEGVEFDDGGHITKETTFEIAYKMFHALHKSCPGCAMGVISMLISMLAVTYIKDEAEHKKIFDHKDWIEYIINGAMTAIDRHEHKDTSVN